MEQTTNPAPKVHHSTIRKEKAAQMDALLKEYGSIEAVKAKLEGGGPKDRPVMDLLPTARPPAPGGDALAWITNETPYVGLVASTAIFTLFPGDVNNKGKGLIQLTNTGSGPWLANPFDMRHKDRVQEQNLKVMKSKWWQHRYPQQTARRIFDEGIRPVPTRAVQAAADFERWDSLGRQAKGVYTPITEFVPLREEVRRLLQKYPETFIDWNHHKGDLDPRFPNPYRNRISSTSGKTRSETRDWVA